MQNTAYHFTYPIARISKILRQRAVLLKQWSLLGCYAASNGKYIDVSDWRSTFIFRVHSRVMAWTVWMAKYSTTLKVDQEVVTQDLQIFVLLNGHFAVTFCRHITSKWNSTVNREARKTCKGTVIGYVQAPFKKASRRADENHTISVSNVRQLRTQLGCLEDKTKHNLIS